MTRLDRPCLGAQDPQTGEHDPCGVPAPGGRCERHAAMREAGRRPSPSRRGYDREYQRDRARVLAPVDGRQRTCSLRLPGCTVWADTADHPVPVDGGRNRLAFRQPLRPACSHCNSSRGSGARDATPPVVEAVEVEDAWHPDP